MIQWLSHRHVARDPCSCFQTICATPAICAPNSDLRPLRCACHASCYASSWNAFWRHGTPPSNTCVFGHCMYEHERTQFKGFGTGLDKQHIHLHPKQSAQTGLRIDANSARCQKHIRTHNNTTCSWPVTSIATISASAK